jgi:hypothetical protein
MGWKLGIDPRQVENRSHLANQVIVGVHARTINGVCNKICHQATCLDTSAAHRISAPGL